MTPATLVMRDTHAAGVMPAEARTHDTRQWRIALNGLTDAPQPC